MPLLQLLQLLVAHTSEWTKRSASISGARSHLLHAPYLMAHTSVAAVAALLQLLQPLQVLHAIPHI